jgi:hypothetical protein
MRERGRKNLKKKKANFRNFQLKTILKIIKILINILYLININSFFLKIIFY